MQIQVYFVIEVNKTRVAFHSNRQSISVLQHPPGLSIEPGKNNAAIFPFFVRNFLKVLPENL